MADQKQQQQKSVNANGGPVEEWLMRDGMANFITNKVDKNALHRWKDELGCQIVPVNGKKISWLQLSGKTFDENNEQLGHILEVLRKAEAKFNQLEPENRFGLDAFKLILRMNIPEQKCGFVRGKYRVKLTKIEESCDVRADFDTEQRDSVPEGFSRLILRSLTVDGLCIARAQIGDLLRRALDINPFGMAKPSQRSYEQNPVIEERIRMPLYNQMNKEMKTTYKEIQVFMEESGISFTPIREGEKPIEWVSLKGRKDKVLETKRRLGQLVYDFKTVQNGEERRSPRPHQNCAEMLVPFPNFIRVIGEKGNNIKQLNDQLNVHLTFIGKNDDKYPDGRKLRIVGGSEKLVEEAKQYIQEHYCQPWGPPIHRQSAENGGGQKKEEEEVDIDDLKVDSDFGFSDDEGEEEKQEVKRGNVLEEEEEEEEKEEESHKEDEEGEELDTEESELSSMNGYDLGELVKKKVGTLEKRIAVLQLANAKLNEENAKLKKENDKLKKTAGK